MLPDYTAIQKFQTAVWDYYHDYARNDLPWRQPETDGSFDPYKIMVSELMLQQTQVQRVIAKYHEFLKIFPNVQALAAAELGDVLRVWSGLGYNRRAKFLHQTAQIIVNDHEGIFPRTNLVSLPGIGTNTASAILAYAFDEPVSFVETNIRTVIIHHFFNDQSNVSDKQVLAVTQAVLDQEHPREWYWALMDYGSYLKQSIGNMSRQSKSYAKQSKFEGSKRQIRGKIIALLRFQSQTSQQLIATINDPRTEQVISELLNESLIKELPNRSLSL